jgi:hypothetical protein
MKPSRICIYIYILSKEEKKSDDNLSFNSSYNDYKIRYILAIIKYYSQTSIYNLFALYK